MTLGSCSFYIERCPPPFGYSSKNMQSLHFLLHHELMSMSCCLSLIILRDFFQGKFHTTWVILSEFCLLKFMSQSSWESIQVQIRNWQSSLHDHWDPHVFSQQAVEDLRVVSYTLPFYSYMNFEDLEDVARDMKTSSLATCITSFLKMDAILVYLRLILRCRSIVYCLRLHFI